MTKSYLYLLLTLLVFISCKDKSENKSKNSMVFVEGGTYNNIRSKTFNKNTIVKDFYIGKYEVTQREWTDIMDDNPSQFKGDDLPVEMVSWYDCIEYCNKRSLREGFETYYIIDKDNPDPDNKSNVDSLKWLVTYNSEANGYRLPTEKEWEYAASGGQESNNYIYSGSDDVEEVAWYWRNSGDEILTGSWVWSSLKQNNCKTKSVGQKEPNELGLFDMSGNVREWCEEWYQDFEIDPGIMRVQRGGGWLGGEYRCKTTNRHHFDASGKGPDQGFRMCRSAIE